MRRQESVVSSSTTKNCEARIRTDTLMCGWSSGSSSSSSSSSSSAVSRAAVRDVPTERRRPALPDGSGVCAISGRPLLCDPIVSARRAWRCCRSRRRASRWSMRRDSCSSSFCRRATTAAGGATCWAALASADAAVGPTSTFVKSSREPTIAGATMTRIAAIATSTFVSPESSRSTDTLTSASRRFRRRFFMPEPLDERELSPSASPATLPRRFFEGTAGEFESATDKIDRYTSTRTPGRVSCTNTCCNVTFDCNAVPCVDSVTARPATPTDMMPTASSLVTTHVSKSMGTPDPLKISTLMRSRVNSTSMRVAPLTAGAAAAATTAESDDSASDSLSDSLSDCAASSITWYRSLTPAGLSGGCEIRYRLPSSSLKMSAYCSLASNMEISPMATFVPMSRSSLAASLSATG
mmetsp:Transcript_1460/g.4618  ORF Transcript_1460/g.4618 Transcript_1460/m.4618 type:complete len:410 (-) Transcript_1460:544-1773(-)